MRCVVDYTIPLIIIQSTQPCEPSYITNCLCVIQREREGGSEGEGERGRGREIRGDREKGVRRGDGQGYERDRGGVREDGERVGGREWVSEGGSEKGIGREREGGRKLGSERASEQGREGGIVITYRVAGRVQVCENVV